MLRSFEPIADGESSVLILGTMPGVASLEKGQYYAHGRNHFWPIMMQLFDGSPDLNYSDRCDMLIQNGVALWDVLHSCLRDGSLDSNIEAEEPNDIAGFIHSHKQLKVVFFNGANAEKFFKKYVRPQLHETVSLHFERLPSTSPANASMSFGQRLEKWKRVLEFI